MNSKSLKPTVLTAFSTATVLTGSAILPGFELFCVNQGEFTFTLSRMLLICALIAGIALPLFILLLLFFRNSKYYETLNALLLAAGATIWLQYAFFSQFMPELEPCWPDPYSPYILLIMLIDLLLVLLPSFLILWQKKWCLRYHWQLALILLAPQTLSVLRTMATFSKPEYNFYEYAIAEDKKFIFAREENIVILVVDAMGEFIFRQVWQNDPELHASLKDFTCFDRMISPIPFTSYAVPALLTGVNASSLPDNDDENDHAKYLKTACWSENSLFLNFKKLGYHTDAYPFNLKTVSYDPALLDNVVLRDNHQPSQQLFLDILFSRFTPMCLRPLLKNQYLLLTDQFVIPAKDNQVVQSKSHDPIFYQQLASHMKTGSFLRGLKYLHIKGTHAPVCTNENLEATRNTDVIRQLRGSLRILELLIQRMKELGIYEQAMIVVAGDHSERYSPEIVALVKRPGEIHNDMQFHSLPCQISDLAGTVLAEKKLRPSDLSLFRVHPVSGTCEMRSDVQSSVLQISNWSKKHDFSIAAAGTSNVHTHPFLTADQRICIPTERNQPPPAAIAFRAQLLDSVDCWETDLIPLKEQTTTHYYQLAMQGLPDGNYLMLQVEKTASSCSNYFSETSPMDNLQISRLPFYLTLRHGQPALCKNCSGSNIRPLQINEKLIFEEWKAYPQLCLSDDCHFTTHGLSLTESSVLEVNLPESSKPMTLQMEIKMNTINAGTLELYDEQTVLIRKNIKCQNYELFTIEFRLPEKIAAKHNLKLQFRYSRNLKNRGRKNVPTIFLTSLILKEN